MKERVFEGGSARSIRISPEELEANSSEVEQRSVSYFRIKRGDVRRHPTGSCKYYPKGFVPKKASWGNASTFIFRDVSLRVFDTTRAPCPFHFLRIIGNREKFHREKFVYRDNERYAYLTLSLSGIKPGIRLLRSSILLPSSQREIEKLKFCRSKIGTILPA